MNVSKNHIDLTGANSVERAGDDRPPPWDESRPPVTSGAARGPNGSRVWWVYGCIALFTASIWLVNSLSEADDAVRRGGAYRLGGPMFFEGTSAVVTLALLPFLRRGVGWTRSSRSWPIAATRASAVAVFFALAHILGMVALRKFSYWCAGSSYVFDFVIETPYEFRKDIITAALIGVAFLSLDRPVPAPEREGIAPQPASAGQAPNPHLWLRDGAAHIRIDAREIIWVGSAGNYVEFVTAAKRHLVRGTLAAEEARLLPFGLVRIHRARLVNLNHAVAVAARPSGDFALQMDTGETLVGSRRYRQAVAGLRGVEEG